MFHKLTKLHGKLYLLMTQVGAPLYTLTVSRHLSAAFPFLSFVVVLNDFVFLDVTVRCDFTPRHDMMLNCGLTSTECSLGWLFEVSTEVSYITVCSKRGCIKLRGKRRKQNVRSLRDHNQSGCIVFELLRCVHSLEKPLISVWCRIVLATFFFYTLTLVLRRHPFLLYQNDH